MDYKVIISRNAWTLEADLNTAVANGWKLHSFVAQRSVKYDWETEYTSVLEKTRT